MQQIIEAAAAFKTGFDTLRSVLGLVKDPGPVLPAGKKEAVSRCLGGGG